MVWGDFSISVGTCHCSGYSLSINQKPPQQFLFWMGTFLVVPMNISAVFSQKSCLEPYSGITAISRLTLVEESIFCTVFSGDLLQWHGLKYSIRLFQADREDSGENWKNHYLAPLLYLCLLTELYPALHWRVIMPKQWHRSGKQL